jgi:hypothetical protein
MSNAVNQLYSPAKVAEQLKRKPGVAIIGDENWNRDRDMMTLAALKKYDDENHRLILKESREYRFNTMPECAAAKWHAWAFAMKKLGVKIVEEIERNPNVARNLGAFYEHRLQKELNERGVRCEERPPQYINVEQDLWKSGMYVYYQGDIVYFISNPMSVRAKEGTIYLANRVQFIIMTNARLNGGANAGIFGKARSPESVQSTPIVSDDGNGKAKVSRVDTVGPGDHGTFYRMWRKLRAVLFKKK